MEESEQMDQADGLPHSRSPRARFRRESLRLYAVTDRAWLSGRTLDSVVREALDGGATFVQLREKSLDGGAFRAAARSVQAVCARYGVPFVINDDVMLAKDIGADGVHIGQDDMAAREARGLLGPDKIVGVSVQTAEEAVRAARDGADYLGVGAVFPTGTKADAASVSLKALRDICRAVDIPVVAIGGINVENVARLSGSGICGVAAVSAIFAERDVRAAAALLRAASERLFSGADAGGAL